LDSPSKTAAGLGADTVWCVEIVSDCLDCKATEQRESRERAAPLPEMIGQLLMIGHDSLDEAFEVRVEG
jgi:hypothetical protein